MCKPLMMKILCLSIHPAIWLFVVKVTQGLLLSVQVCAREISGADVAVDCECRLAS